MDAAAGGSFVKVERERLTEVEEDEGENEKEEDEIEAREVVVDDDEREESKDEAREEDDGALAGAFDEIKLLFHIDGFARSNCLSIKEADLPRGAGWTNDVCCG